MKFNSLYLKIALLVINILVVASHLAFSQKNKYSDGESKGIFYGISLGVFQSEIKNDPTLSISGVQTAPIFPRINGSAEFGYFFGKTIGVSVVVGYDPHKTKLALGSYQSKLQSTDTEGESYERQISGRNIEEIQRIGFANAALCLNIRIPFGNKMGLILKPGLMYAYPVVNKYESRGIFTYKGYFVQYPVTLENLPEYGFPTDLDSKANGKFELNKTIFGSTGSVEFYFYTNFSVGFWFSKSFSNLSAYNSPETFQLSNEANQINSLMGGSSKVSYSSYGFRLNCRLFK